MGPQLPRSDRYVLGPQLGQGGMGVVFEAFDNHLRRPVAIKWVARQAEAEALARVVREAQALARLNHPNVVQIYEVRDTRSGLVLVMEKLGGLTLRAWLRERDRPRAEIIDVFTQAAAGLLAAHEQGLVHRDFKPDNVMISSGGRVRVMDFGLARAPMTTTRASSSHAEAGGAPGSDRLTRTGLVLGTPLYMAPEQHLAGRVDARADQFAWCLALIESLTGRYPYPRGSSAEIVMAKRTGDVDPEALRMLPRWLRTLVSRGLAPDPEQRFGSMAELQERLRSSDHRGRRLRRGGLLLAGVLGAVLAVDLHGVASASETDATAATGGLDTVAASPDEVQGLLDRGHVMQAYEIAVAARLEAHASAAARSLAEASLRSGDLPQAMDWASEAIARGESSGEPRARAASHAARAEVSIEVENYDDAVEDLRRATEIVASAEGPESAENVLYATALGSALSRVGRFSEAIAVLEHGNELARTHYPPSDPRVLQAEDQLALVLGWQGRFDEALPLIEHVLAVTEQREGFHSPALLPYLNNLGGNQAGRGEFDRAYATYRRAAEISTASNGPDHPETAGFVMNLGVAYREGGRPREALEALTRSLHLLERAGAGPGVIGLVYGNLGDACLDLEAYEDALRFYGKGLERLQSRYGEHHLYVATTWLGMGVALMELGDLDQAGPYIERAHAVHRRQGTRPLEWAWAHEAMARLEVARRPGDVASLARARALAESAAAAYASMGPAGQRYHARVTAWLRATEPT